MPPMIDAAAWAEVRRLYTETATPAAAIARGAGISPATLRKRALREDWPARPKPRGAKSVRSAKLDREKPRERPARNDDPLADIVTREAQVEVVARLFRAISKKLQHMEDRMANGDVRSAQDEERETRALATMIRNFERVTEAATDFDRARETGNAEAPVSRADAERMRREIAERVQRLSQDGPPARDTREP